MLALIRVGNDFVMSTHVLACLVTNLIKPETFLNSLTWPTRGLDTQRIHTG